MSFHLVFVSVWRFNVPFLVVSLVHKNNQVSVSDGLVKCYLNWFPTLSGINTSVGTEVVTYPLVSPKRGNLFVGFPGSGNPRS